MVAPPFYAYFLCVLPAVFDTTQAVDARVSGVFPSMSLVGSSASRSFLVHPGQACTLAEGKKWATQIRRALPAGWLSLLNGSTPRVLLQYNALAVPVAL